ncbi:prenylated Rab acceptor protein 1-like isoform X3 [Glandiceps talaboti]
MEAVELSGDLEISKNESTDEKSGMALSLSNVSAKDWVQKQRDNIQPWHEFINTSKISKPKSATGLTKRVTKNLEKFQSNYLLVSIGLVIYCVITSPLLLVACAFLIGGCYFIRARQAAGKVILLGRGRELTVAQQYLAVCMISFPMFFLAGAGGAVFWVIGASVFLVVLHASLMAIDTTTPDDADLTMETV